MKKLLIWLLVIWMIGCVVFCLIRDNTTVGLNTITVTEANLPVQFDGFRIAHISDLHNSDLWELAIKRLKEADPDIICITGDLVDGNRTDLHTALEFISQAVAIAPCYYVTGNHEVSLDRSTYQELIYLLEDAGVIILDQEERILQKDGASIALAGNGWGNNHNLDTLSQFDGYRILLSHQPEIFDTYAQCGYDLVLSGHAHGGQIRVLFLGGLYAPGQGILPEYDAGLYSRGATDMIVSRGIGNSTFPVRLNNQPEVILIELKCE